MRCNIKSNILFVLLNFIFLFPHRHRDFLFSVWFPATLHVLPEAYLRGAPRNRIYYNEHDKVNQGIEKANRSGITKF